MFDPQNDTNTTDRVPSTSIDTHLRAGESVVVEAASREGHEWVRIHAGGLTLAIHVPLGSSVTEVLNQLGQAEDRRAPDPDQLALVEG